MQPFNFGIDLGTTNSLIAKYSQGKVQVYKNPIGQKETLASVVAYRPERIMIGDKARDYLTKDAVNVFSGFKRKMGTDEKYYVVNIDDNVTPVELSTLVLRELKKFLPPQDQPLATVITVPASFDSMQSNATLRAGQQAGFQEVVLLQEPIAACLAFFNNGEITAKKEGYWLVYDLGGGTFDVALVENKGDELKIINHEGNNFLGGLDFDFAIIDKIVVPEIIRQTGIADFEEQFRVKHGMYEKLFYEVMYYAEEAKKELSSYPSTSIDFAAELNGKRYDFAIPISRGDLDTIFLPLVNETILLLNNILENKQLKPTDINEIILVGGSTFLPQVREQLQLQTGIPLNYAVDPTTCVAVGAAYYAANKQFTPIVPAGISAEEQQRVNELLTSIAYEPTDIEVELKHAHSTKDKEEVLMIACSGQLEKKTYRIVRTDGGFDTGLMPVRAKKSEFLPLLTGMENKFFLQIYDAAGQEITTLKKEITITQGIYNIDGQPLPHDISIEVDDVANNTTKLETIFQRNSLLPQKRTLYREISKTIKKGSDDAITINIMEGDGDARPSSNLTIGCITVSGKDLQTDLIKGSDIEIQIHLTDSRVLHTQVFLVMTQQEFKNVFAISEKIIDLDRIKEQYLQLENELVGTIREFQQNSDEIWEIKAASVLDGLRALREKLFALKPQDKSDEKYILAEKITRISREYDRLGGNERMAQLIENYFYLKENIVHTINQADFEKEELNKVLRKIEQTESSVLNSKSISVVENKIKQLDDLHWQALSNTTSFLITRFVEFKALDSAYYKDANAARALFKMADTALENQRYFEFRRHVFSISSLLNIARENNNDYFKGTGIG